MPSPAADGDEAPASRRAVTWLRLVKLRLSVVLLALGILAAVARLGPSCGRSFGPGGRRRPMEPLSLDDVRTRHDPAEEPFYEFLRAGGLSVGRYVLDAGAEDPQSPHTEDEIYYVLDGSAAVRIGDERHPVAPGDVVYVERGVEHRFVDIERLLDLLVVFAPAEGSLADG